ncbi:MAG: pyruvate kinase alpha/beta domain-containing protein [Thermomicrobiales bacterium]
MVFTQTGASVRRVAKYRLKPPIIGLATDIETARRLNLIWGVRSGVVPIEENSIISSAWPGRRSSRRAWRQTASSPSSPAFCP